MSELESLEHARARDRGDPLAYLRAEFARPQHHGRDAVYLCGHSLGLQPHRSRVAVLESLDTWAARGVEGHFSGEHAWYHADTYPEAMLADLVGARPDEVAIANGLTVNLHLLMASFYRPSGGRTKILIEAGAFPSDRYAVTSQLDWHSLDAADHLVVVPGDEAGRVSSLAIIDAIRACGEELALVLVGGVHYLTGEALDIAAIVSAGHAVGATVGVDLAHAAGNCQLALHDDNVDFAAWCTYKYLNAGPGAVGALFVHQRHGEDSSMVRLAGWWGNDPGTRFAMDQQVAFVAMRGAAGWKISNPPIVSLASVRGSLEVFALVGMTRLRERSMLLTASLAALLDDVDGVEQITPHEPHRRGAMLTLRLTAPGETVVARLSAAGVVVDFRPPAIVRVAPAPLYSSYEDLWRFATTLKTTLAEVN